MSNRNYLQLEDKESDDASLEPERTIAMLVHNVSQLCTCSVDNPCKPVKPACHQPPRIIQIRGINWTIDLRMDKKKENMGLYLLPLQPTAGRTTYPWMVYVKFTAQVLGKKDEILKTMSFEHIEFTSKRWGWPSFIKTSELSTFADDDTLKLQMILASDVPRGAICWNQNPIRPPPPPSEWFSTPLYHILQFISSQQQIYNSIEGMPNKNKFQKIFFKFLKKQASPVGLTEGVSSFSEIVKMMKADLNLIPFVSPQNDMKNLVDIVVGKMKPALDNFCLVDISKLSSSSPILTELRAEHTTTANIDFLFVVLNSESFQSSFKPLVNNNYQLQFIIQHKNKDLYSALAGRQRDFNYSKWDPRRDGWLGFHHHQSGRWVKIEENISCWETEENAVKQRKFKIDNDQAHERHIVLGVYKRVQGMMTTDETNHTIGLKTEGNIFFDIKIEEVDDNEKIQSEPVTKTIEPTDETATPASNPLTELVSSSSSSTGTEVDWPVNSNLVHIDTDLTWGDIRENSVYPAIIYSPQLTKDYSIINFCGEGLDEDKNSSFEEVFSDDESICACAIPTSCGDPKVKELKTTYLNKSKTSGCFTFTVTNVSNLYRRDERIVLKGCIANNTKFDFELFVKDGDLCLNIICKPGSKLVKIHPFKFSLPKICSDQCSKSCENLVNDNGHYKEQLSFSESNPEEEVLLAPLCDIFCKFGCYSEKDQVKIKLDLNVIVEKPKKKKINKRLVFRKKEINRISLKDLKQKGSNLKLEQKENNIKEVEKSKETNEAKDVESMITHNEHIEKDEDSKERTKLQEECNFMTDKTPKLISLDPLLQERASSNSIASLTHGALPRIFEGEEVHQPNLQVLGIQKKPCWGGSSILLSDGEFSSFFLLCSLSTHLNHMMHEKQLEKYTIIKVDKYFYNQILGHVIQEVSVVKPGHQIKEKIGNPQAMGSDETKRLGEAIVQSQNANPNVRGEIKEANEQQPQSNYETKKPMINDQTSSNKPMGKEEDSKELTKLEEDRNVKKVGQNATPNEAGDEGIKDIFESSFTNETEIKVGTSVLGDQKDSKTITNLDSKECDPIEQCEHYNCSKPADVRCKKCKRVFYCSKTCRDQHRTRHQEVCDAFRVIRQYKVEKRRGLEVD